MSKKSYIPTKEAEFSQWAKNLVTVAQQRGTSWQIPSNQTSNLYTSFTNYDAKYQAAINPATRTKIAVAAKNEAKKAFTAMLREYCMGQLLHNPLVTIADLDLLGLPARDTKPTPVPPPHTYPIGKIDTSLPQTHIISVKDSHEDRPRGGLPAGVHGFETWRKTGGEMPTAHSDFSYVGFSSTTSMNVGYELENSGTRVWYRFRWVNARNQPGPWSESIISAIVP